MEKIGERIAVLLKNEGLSQKELAQLVGITESALSRYIKGERQPKLEVIANLATALNTTSDYLISGNEEETSFNNLSRLIARGTKTLTQEEKMKLMRLLTK
ncbi:MAG: helix-turn-helix transcriptional regulator [Clostridia bacterium]|nr:helix-turn-helix transcriptional regulator [Clostridia bacterium]